MHFYISRRIGKPETAAFTSSEHPSAKHTNLMKRSHLILACICFLSTQAFAQNLPRFFDNFDTARGVQVQRPTMAVAVTAKTTNKKLVKKTSQTQSRMNVTDGFARPQDVYRADRLMMGTAVGMKGFTTGDAMIDSYIVDSSRRYNIDPLLIYAQMHQESSFKLKALSYKGASGLMQLMPATARRLGVTNIYDPKQNIEGGIKYMRMLLNMFNQDVNLALAGYNAGEGAVMKYGNSIPPYNETREYVRRISARYSQISNPSMARNATRVDNKTATKLEAKESRPLNVYEPVPVTIRLADGRMRLVNQ